MNLIEALRSGKPFVCHQMFEKEDDYGYFVGIFEDRPKLALAYLTNYPIDDKHILGEDGDPDQFLMPHVTTYPITAEMLFRNDYVLWEK